MAKVKTMKALACLASTACMLLAAPAVAQHRAPLKRLPALSLNGRRLPFAEGVSAGDILYLSGQIGLEPDGKLAAGIDRQTTTALDHISTALAFEGLSWKSVTRCTVMLSDMGNWAAFNAIYERYIDKDNLPARSAMGVSALALGALVEVQCDAFDPRR